jgi:hypothetical protein
MAGISNLLPTTVRIFLSTHYWTNQFSFSKFLQSFFAVCGIAAAGAEAGKQVVGLFNSPGQVNWFASFLIECHWWVIGAIALMGSLTALYLLKPTTRVTARLRSRDLNLRIEVGDLFATSDTLVIGTNTTFDTSLAEGLISERSLQGQFTKRYFEAAVNHLDADIEASLRGVAAFELAQAEKAIGKRMLYEMGTVAKVNVKGRSAYLVAMARMNGHGVASTRIEDVRTALAALWLHVSEKGGGLPRLRVPILGTGFGKLIETREEVIREILKSFVAACASDRFCDEFTLVISVEDFLEHQIDLTELGDFMKYLTTYTEMRSATDTGKGTGISA